MIRSLWVQGQILATTVGHSKVTPRQEICQPYADPQFFTFLSQELLLLGFLSGGLDHVVAPLAHAVMVSINQKGKKQSGEQSRVADVSAALCNPAGLSLLGHTEPATCPAAGQGHQTGPGS